MPKMGLTDILTTSIPANEFPERLDRALDWKPLEKTLQGVYPATTGRSLHAPLAAETSTTRAGQAQPKHAHETSHSD